MKKGISYWAFGGKTYAEAFAFAKEHGFDGVEVTLDDSGEVTMESTDEEILAIKKQAEDAGIQLYSVATGLFWTWPLTSNDPAVREKAMAVAKRELEIAALLGCDTVLMVPALVNEETPYDVAWERAVRALRVLSVYAEKCGVRIGAENVWNGFLLSPMEMRNFVDEIDSPWVGAYFDVGNVVFEGWPEQWIRILGARILKVHFKDYVREKRTLEGFVDLGAGSVKFDRVMAALRDAGYEDFCTAEVFAEDEDGFAAARRAAEAYQTIF